MPHWSNGRACCVTGRTADFQSPEVIFLVRKKASQVVYGCDEADWNVPLCAFYWDFIWTSEEGGEEGNWPTHAKDWPRLHGFVGDGRTGQVSIIFSQ